MHVWVWCVCAVWMCLCLSLIVDVCKYVYMCKYMYELMCDLCMCTLIVYSTDLHVVPYYGTMCPGSHLYGNCTMCHDSHLYGKCIMCHGSHLYRLGQYLVSTLPLLREYSEANIDLYAELPPASSPGPVAGSKVADVGNGEEEEGDMVDGESVKDDVEDASSVKGDTTSVKGDTTSVKGDTTSVKGDTTSVKGDTASVKGDTTSVKGETTSIKGDTGSVKGGITHSSSTISFSPTPSAPPNPAKAIRHIVVRNFLLDMLVSLSQTEHLEIDSK